MNDTPFRVWHDDIRPAPQGWVWARTNTEAERLLLENDVAEISLDHDLGLHGYTEAEIEANPELIMGRGQAEETGYDLVLWMIFKNRVPPLVTIHSWNPDGAKKMAALLNEYGHDCLIAPYEVRR